MDNEEKFEIGVKALIVNEKNEILVLKAGAAELRYEKRDFWDLPGGRIQIGFGIKETLEREIEEELGISGKAVSIINIFDAGISHFKVLRNEERLSLMLVVYKCRLIGKHEFKLSEEHSEYKWANKEETKYLLKTKFSEEFIKRLDNLD